MRNQVSYNGKTLNIQRGPFGNTFVQEGKAKLAEDGLVEFYARCTADSDEPGRIYCSASTLEGELVDYFTVN